MDVTALNTQQAGAALTKGADDRAAALADARREASAEQVRSSEDAKARSAQQLAETREAVARALGANTRLSISKSANAPIFVYQAIDIDTGKVVNEWPQEQFLALVKGVREDVQADVETAGLILDNEV